MIFAEFTHLCDRFRRVSTPDRLPDEWVSPYRLLWGAAYSVGIAENALENESGADFALPLDLSSSLKLAVEGNDADSISWLPRWRASYMLTNAVFRVAAATEKICYLADPDLQWDRGKLWDALRNPNSSLSTKVPIAPKLLGHMPSLKDRASYLDGQREVFHGPLRVALPLVCAFIQTDRDKHVAYKPLKELLFDHALATQSLREACDLWDAAVDAQQRTA